MDRWVTLPLCKQALSKSAAKTSKKYMKIIPLLRRYELLLQRTIWVYKTMGLTTGGQSSRLEKKLTINSWKRHALYDSVF